MEPEDQKGIQQDIENCSRGQSNHSVKSISLKPKLIIEHQRSCHIAVSYTHLLTGPKTTLKLRRKNLTLKRKVILPCISLGLAPFIMQFTESALFISFNTSLLKYGGDIAVGAMTILSSVMQFSMLPLQGLTQGAQPIISFNYGAKNIGRVKQAFRLLLASAACYSTLLWGLCMFTPKLFISIFTLSLIHI